MAKRKGSKRTTRKSSTPGLTLSYGGPVRLNTFNGQDSRPIKVNLSYTFTMSSDATGVLRNIIRGPGLTSSSDWVFYTDLYQEYRVLAIELEYMPFFNGTYNPSLLQGSGAINVVHTPLAGLPSSLDDIVQYSTWSPLKTSNSFKKDWKMFGVEESVFTPTSAILANHGGIQFYCDSLTPNSSYGRGVVTYLVEFRGRR